MTAARLVSSQGKKKKRDEGEGGSPSQGNLGDGGPSSGVVPEKSAGVRVVVGAGIGQMWGFERSYGGSESSVVS